VSEGGHRSGLGPEPRPDALPDAGPEAGPEERPDPAYEPPLPGAPRPVAPQVAEERPAPPNPDERRAKRAILRVARVLIGTIVLLFLVGLAYRLLS
jgi:hypothetical protein